MSDRDDLLTQLRDVGVTHPRAGDAGDERIWSALADEMSRPDRSRRTRRPERRRARLRIARRPAMRLGALGAMAAVAAAVVLATGAIGGSGGEPRVAFPGAPASHVGAFTTQDTAYVIDRVKARVAADVRSGIVVHVAEYSGGRVATDGSIVRPVWRIGAFDEYRAPDGAQYSHGTLFYRDGSTELVVDQTSRPGAAGGRGRMTETDIDPRTHEYSVTPYSSYEDPDAQRSPGPFTDPAGIRRALSDGRVAERGTTTVDGTRAIVLSMIAANAPGNPNTEVVLYVDASTDRVLRTVAYQVGFPDITVCDWVPATARAAAAAENASVPSGDTRTSAAQVSAGTHRR